MQRETINYNGINFYRYPESKTKSERVYFSGRAKVNGEYKKIRLHVYKYICEIGSIPKYHVIHHHDENPLNNDIKNLICVDKGKHQSEHMLKDERKEISRENLKKYAQPKAIEWHKSDEGREWHRKHVYKALHNQNITAKCDECGIEFVTQTNRGDKKYFCCKKHQWKYQARIQREKRYNKQVSKCPVCGNETIGKSFCSRECYHNRSI